MTFWGGDDGSETTETESNTEEEPTEGDDNDDENDDEGWEDYGVGDDEPTDDDGDDGTSEKEDKQPNPAPMIPPPPPPPQVLTAVPKAAYVPDPESISTSVDVEKKQKDTEGSEPHDMDSPPNGGIRPPTPTADANEQLQNRKDSCNTPICNDIAIGSTLFS